MSASKFASRVTALRRRVSVPFTPVSVETLLLLMGLALILPSMAFIGVLVTRDARQERGLIEQRLQQEAADLAAAIDREISRIMTMLDTLALSKQLADRDYAGFQSSAVAAVRRMKSAILVVDGAGGTVVNTRVPFGTELPPTADPASFEWVKAHRAPVVSNLFVGRTANTWVFDVLMPVERDAAIEHVIMMSMTADHLISILREQKLPLGWSTGIVDRNGTIMARLLDHDRFVGQPLPPELHAQSARSMGVFTATNVEGQPILRAVAVSARTGWAVSANVPLATVDAGVRASQMYVLLATAVLLALLLGLARFFSTLLVRPMRDLVRTAATVGTPSQPALPPSPVREVNEIASVLKAASFQLNARMSQILASELRLTLAQKTAGMAHTDIDLATRRVTASETFPALFGFNPAADFTALAHAFLRRVHADDRSKVALFFDAAMRSVGPADTEFRIRLPTGNWRWIRSQCSTLPEIGGGDPAATAALQLPALGGTQPRRMITTSIDITRDREQTDHIRFLMHEVVHRSKNLLSIIQSLATQTARASPDVAQFTAKFSHRLRGIALSQDVLVAQNWQRADLATLVRAQVEPFIAQQAARLTVDGPAVEVTPQAAQALGLALHELATNAVKYGAFSTPSGRIDVGWQIAPGADGAVLHLVWREAGGPPVVKPQRRGFGSIVLERTAAQSLGADIATTFDPAGLVWTVTAPLARIGRRGQQL